MAWVRWSDDAQLHPRVLAIPADARLEAFGFFRNVVERCAQVGGDHVVTVGQIEAAAWGADYRRPLQQCLSAGLMWPHQDATGWYVLFEDDQCYNVRTRAELEWERERKRDARGDLKWPVRLRDGDACRYCGEVVNWGTSAARTKRGGTLDHRVPGRRAQSADELVVACNGCNSRRGGLTQHHPLADVERIMPLLPPPTSPIYKRATQKSLAEQFGPDWKEKHRPTPAGEQLVASPPLWDSIPAGEQPVTAERGTSGIQSEHDHAVPMQARTVQAASLAPETRTDGPGLGAVLETGHLDADRQPGGGVQQTRPAPAEPGISAPGGVPPPSMSCTRGDVPGRDGTGTTNTSPRRRRGNRGRRRS